MRVIQDTEKLINQMRLYDKINGGHIQFNLWPRQSEYLNYIHTYPLVIMLKKRQVAGSTLTGVDSLCQCAILPNFLVLVLSKTGDDSEEHLRRVLECYNSLDDEFKVAMPIKGKPTLDKIEFTNGSRFISLPANKGAGFTPDRVVIDEAPKITIKNSKIDLTTVLNNVFPGLEKSQGQLIMLGTAEGYGLFQQMWDRSKRGIGGWKSFFFSCWDDPTFTKAQREKIVEDLGEDLANQEYPRTDTEAFLMSGNCRFNRTCLNEIRETTIEPGTKGFFERVGKNRVKFTKDPNGWVTMFRDVARGKKYLCGADPCQGLEVSKLDKRNTDENGANIVTARELEQVCVIRNRHEPDVIGEEILMAAQYYNDAYTAIERNKERSVVLYLVRKNYWNLYFEERLEDERQKRTRNVGWFTTASNKRIMISYLDRLIREKGLILHDAETLAQLQTFIRNPDGSCEAQEGCKDDLVSSLMIALQMAETCEIESIDVDQKRSGEPRRFEDSWRHENGNLLEGELCGNDLLDAAFNNQINGFNYFNR